MHWWGYAGLWVMLVGPFVALGASNTRAWLRGRSWHRHCEQAIEVAR